jgi:hypothetical protein
MPSVWPINTPDGFSDDPSERRSLWSEVVYNNTIHKIGIPDFDKSIIRSTDKHIPGFSVRPAAAVNVIFVSYDTYAPPVGRQIINFAFVSQTSKSPWQWHTENIAITPSNNLVSVSWEPAAPDTKRIINAPDIPSPRVRIREGDGYLSGGGIEGMGHIDRGCLNNVQRGFGLLVSELTMDE